MIIIIIAILALCMIGVWYLVIRVAWLYFHMTKLEKTDPELCGNLDLDHIMLKRFWVWDFKKFTGE